MRGEEANSPAKETKEEEEGIDLNNPSGQESEEAKLVENQDNLDATKSLVASKRDEPNQVPRPELNLSSAGVEAPQEGVDLRSNEDAILAYSKGEVTLQDPEVQDDDQEGEKEEEKTDVDDFDDDNRDDNDE